mgnify:CR=1 FL=1
MCAWGGTIDQCRMSRWGSVGRCERVRQFLCDQSKATRPLEAHAVARLNLWESAVSFRSLVGELASDDGNPRVLPPETKDKHPSEFAGEAGLDGGAPGQSKVPAGGRVMRKTISDQQYSIQLLTAALAVEHILTPHPCSHQIGSLLDCLHTVPSGPSQAPNAMR